jgi:hypothetical protein
VPVDDDCAGIEPMSEEPQDQGFEAVRVVSVAGGSRSAALRDLTL